METEYYQKTALKRNAEQQARKGKNKVPLKDHCELCGSTDYLERHHPDYTKPLEVKTLCRTCHARQRAKQSDNCCICPKCGSTFTVRLGRRVTKQGLKQTRLCRDCGKGFYESEHLATGAKTMEKPVKIECICPDCGSTNTIKSGKRITKKGPKQTRFCQNCGRGFIELEHLAKGKIEMG